MNWSKYTFLEKWKIIRSKIFHKNVICMAMHTNNLELFEKILKVEKIRDINTANLNYYALVRGDKYYNFFQKLNNYFSEKNITLGKEQRIYLDFILEYTKIFDPPNFTKDEQFQSRYSYEETLEYYDCIFRNLTVENTEYFTQIKGTTNESNYAELNLP